MIKPWCTCLWNRQDGWTLNGNIWVHAGCRKPSKMVYEKIIRDKALNEVDYELNWNDDIMEEFYYLLGEE